MGIPGSLFFFYFSREFCESFESAQCIMRATIVLSEEEGGKLLGLLIFEKFAAGKVRAALF